MSIYLWIAVYVLGFVLTAALVGFTMERMKEKEDLGMAIWIAALWPISLSVLTICVICGIPYYSGQYLARGRNKPK